MPNENNSYYTELTHNLKHKSFTVGPEENNLLSIELDGKPLCRATENGGVRWHESDIADDRRSALDSVIAIAKTTHEYMRQMEAAPQLTADGLEGDFRLLSEFNGTVLAGHMSRPDCGRGTTSAPTAEPPTTLPRNRTSPFAPASFLPAPFLLPSSSRRSIAA